MMRFRLLAPNPIPASLNVPRREVWVRLNALGADDDADLEWFGEPGDVDEIREALTSGGTGFRGAWIEASTTPRDLLVAMHSPTMAPFEPVQISGRELFVDLQSACAELVELTGETLVALTTGPVVDLPEYKADAWPRLVDGVGLVAALADEITRATQPLDAELLELRDRVHAAWAGTQLTTGVDACIENLENSRYPGQANREAIMRFLRALPELADCDTAERVRERLRRLVAAADVTLPASESNSLVRHDIGERDRWAQSLDYLLERQKLIYDRQPRQPSAFDLFATHCERAALSSIFQREKDAMYASVAAAAGTAAVAILAQSAERSGNGGEVLFTEPGRTQRIEPAASGRFGYPEWVSGFSMACITRDRPAIDMLCHPAAIASCEEPRGIDGFWPFLCGLLAAAATEPEAAKAWYDDYKRMIAAARIAEPQLIEHRIEPLAELALALAGRDEAEFRAALEAALFHHRRYYEQSERANDRFGFLAVWPLGLAAAGAGFGWRLEPRSNYLESHLVRGDFPRRLTKVAYYFPDLAVLSECEAVWFLDLHGFPRDQRASRRLTTESHEISRYEARGAPGIPVAVADFVHLNDAEPPRRTDPPLALDAGQLLRLAERFAEDPDAEGARVAEAVACVDACLQRIGEGSDTVDSASITSAAGRQYYEQEPGRFRRERLIAYRDGLAAHTRRAGSSERAADTHGAQAPNGQRSDPSVLSAYASIEIIRGQVRPLLEALPRMSPDAIAEALAPRDGDFDKVFAREAVDTARTRYRELWTRPVRVDATSEATIRIHVAPAGMLSEDNELSFHFPRGYRGIASLLNPHRTWVAWTYVEPGSDSGISFDGLVWAEDHWAWFPKPHRALRNLAD